MGLRNPLPPLRKATDAAANIIFLERDLYVLKAELRAARQMRKVALLAASVVSFGIALGLSLFWLTQTLHEAGWSSGFLAIASFVILNCLTGFLFALAFAPERPDTEGRPP
ncbi:MAG: hypothetical protein P4M08_07815 [Oligoflexia bacterium]|nr:hypothetical protein [Oligoflexia bacterium]